MRKPFPFALAGLAAPSVSVFAADSSVKSDTGASTGASATGNASTAGSTSTYNVPSSAVDSRHDNPGAGGGGEAGRKARFFFVK